MKPQIIIGTLLIALISTSSRVAAAGPVERRIAVAPGVFLRSIEAGKTPAQPVIFIPGWSTGADIWASEVERFATDHRVIAFDPRSQGQSTKTTTGNTPEQRAADLHALLAAEHVRRPVLVGWSQAAQDIAAYVLRYGTQDIAGIVLVDAAIADGAEGIAARPEQASRQFGLFTIYAADQEAYLRGMFGAIISKPQPPRFVDRAIATAMKTPPSTGIAMLVADLFSTDRTPALAKMDCPVLFIAAATSGELSRQESQAKQVRNGHFVKIDDASHAVFRDQPAQFANALANFLGEVETQSRASERRGGG